MKLSDFTIGCEFTTTEGAFRWRCTDIGTRTVIAIKLQHHEDQSWYLGPPYAVQEMVFADDDLNGCEAV